jgi:hypothetical protein
VLLTIGHHKPAAVLVEEFQTFVRFDYFCKRARQHLVAAVCVHIDALVVSAVNKLVQAVVMILQHPLLGHLQYSEADVNWDVHVELKKNLIERIVKTDE